MDLSFCFTASIQRSSRNNSRFSRHLNITGPSNYYPTPGVLWHVNYSSHIMRISWFSCLMCLCNHLKIRAEQLLKPLGKKIIKLSWCLILRVFCRLQRNSLDAFHDNFKSCALFRSPNHFQPSFAFISKQSNSWGTVWLQNCLIWMFLISTTSQTIQMICRNRSCCILLLVSLLRSASFASSHENRLFYFLFEKKQQNVWKKHRPAGG